jgi:hypothetical protein
MKMRSLFYAIGLGFCALSCSHPHHKSSSPLNPETIMINDQDGRPGSLSEFTESTDYIQLETTPDCLLGGISKIEFKLNKIYILHSGGSQLAIFDATGKYLLKIDKKGKGPGEYQQILDFDVDDQTGDIVLTQSRSVLIFTAQGEHKKTQKLPFVAFNMKKGDNLYFSSLGFDLSPENCFNLYEVKSEDLSMSKRYLPIHKNSDQYIYSKNNAFASCLGELWFHHGISDTVFSITESGITPVYAINYGHSISIAEIDNANDLTQRTMLFNNPNYLHGFYNMLFNENFFWFEYGHQGNDHFVLYDRKAKEVKDYTSLKNDIDKLPLSSPFFMDSLALYFIIHPYSFMETDNVTTEGLSDKVKNLGSRIDDNPVILKAILKKKL